MSDIAQNAVRLGDFNVISWTLALSLTGVGSLEAEIDVDEDQSPPAGTLDLTFAVESGDPLSFRVTVIDVLEDGDLRRETLGRHRIFAVQGEGGLRNALPGRDYAEIDPRLVLVGILEEAGEQAPDLSDLGDVPRLARWLRPAGTGRALLTRLCARIGAGWRVLPTGVVRVAAETWEPYAGELPLYTEEPDATGIAALALDAPDLLPGVTIPRPEGQTGAPYRVAAVVYSMTEEGVFRARVQLQLPAGGEGPRREQWRAAVHSVLPPLALYVPHLCTVVDQDGDGLLGLRLDSRGAPALTIAGVPIWSGLPGCKVKAKKGARCILQFAGGNEDLPMVTGWEAESEFKTITFGAGPPDTMATVLQIGSDA